MTQMRKLIISLIVCVAATAVPATPALFDFESGEPFKIIEGTGTATLDATQPLAGQKSLRLELPPAVNVMTVISTPFPVLPFHLYEVRWKTRLDRGTEIRMRLRQDAGYGPQDIFANTDQETEINYLYTLPGVKEARLVLWMRIEGKALGRTVMVDDIELLDRGLLHEGQSQEMFFNGAFEIPDCWPPPGWGFWGRTPDEAGRCTESPHDGASCYRTKGANYVVLPSVLVRDRDFVHLRLWLRGKGTVSLGVHHLNRRGERVGWSSPVTGDAIPLQEDAWRPVDVLMAGVGGTRYLQIVVITMQSTVDLDSVSVRRVGSVFRLLAPQ